jgi:pantetheine-phosphate adenylyltransferase
MIALLILALISALLVSLFILVNRIIFPTILTYPWYTKNPTKCQQQTIVFAGSFNPPHNGHLAMIEYLAKTYQNVILVIGMNPNKIYKVSPQVRAEILEHMIASSKIDKSRVRVKVISGYIWRYAMEQKAVAMIRGVRTWEKDGKEERALYILNTWGPIVFGPLKWPLETIYMESDPKFVGVSSTLIRDVCNRSQTLNNDALTVHLEGLVPREVQNDILQAYMSNSDH